MIIVVRLCYIIVPSPKKKIEYIFRLTLEFISAVCIFMIIFFIFNIELGYYSLLSNAS